jgi:hypothetical protein
VILKVFSDAQLWVKIFDACRISATRISAPKRLTVGANKNISFVVIGTSFWT